LASLREVLSSFDVKREIERERERERERENLGSFQRERNMLRFFERE